MPRHPVYNLHHLGNRNVGDRACVPLLYFSHLATRSMRIVDLSLTDPSVSTLRNELVVLGGGGLLNPWCWHEVILPLLKRGNRVIGWGIGHHHDNVPAHRYLHARDEDWTSSLDRYPVDYPLERLWMCGVRDRGTLFEYVPCSTCMHPVFDRTPEPAVHDLVVYEHGALEPIPIPGVPKISNVGETPLEEIVGFLASGRSVVTNSYHGAYWSVLLGRRVLLYEPWCSKFPLMQCALPSCTREDWPRRLPDAVAYPAALADCRLRSAEFAERVFAALDGEIRRRTMGAASSSAP